MRLLLGLILSLVVASGIGLGLTWLALTHGIVFDRITVNAWTAQSKIGTAEIDPYSRAVIARSGELVLGFGDGISFIAKTDDSGKPLDGRCDVVVSGTTPQARYFTLSLYDLEGRLVANSLNRQGFSSQELVRHSNGNFEIAVAPRARPGNWLPTGGIERYQLVMRLYDTPVGIATRAEREIPMPAIQYTGPCR